MSTFEKYPITNELVNFESIKSRNYFTKNLKRKQFWAIGRQQAENSKILELHLTLDVFIVFLS